MKVNIAYYAINRKNRIEVYVYSLLMYTFDKRKNKPENIIFSQE